MEEEDSPLCVGAGCMVGGGEDSREGGRRGGDAGAWLGLQGLGVGLEASYEGDASALVGEGVRSLLNRNGSCTRAPGSLRQAAVPPLLSPRVD
eukprot:246777-Hanusia_phi.AAC.1